MAWVARGSFVQMRDGKIARALRVYAAAFGRYRVSLEIPAGDGTLEYRHVDAAELTAPVYGPIGPVRLPQQCAEREAAVRGMGGV